MRPLLAPALLVMAFSGCGGGGSVDNGPHVEFVLSGTVSYGDRVYGRLPDQARYGFTRTEAKPVRLATVQVVNGRGKVIQETGTDESGTYVITAAGGSRESMRLRVLAQTRTGASVAVNDFSGNVLSVSKAFTPEALPTPLDMAVTGDLAGAFNMLDVYAAAGEFVHEKSGEIPPALAVYWQPGGTPPGGTTYFCRSCPYGIYVLGGEYVADTLVGDADQFDDDVLLHEYGHFLEQSFGVLHSPGGTHTLLDNTQDLRLAWSEGVSSFMAGAIKAWLADGRHGALSSEGLPSSSYMDTRDGIAGAGGGFYHDFNAVPTWLDTAIRYSSSETAVAKVLWNLYGNGAGMDDIWEVFSNSLAATSAVQPASLETFWDAWQASTLVALPPEAAVHAFAERYIHYSSDEHETDDSLLLARGAYEHAEDHNLFKAGLASETDFVPFNADTGRRYRIETYDLVNGAHTWLRITDPNGIPLAAETGSKGSGIQPNGRCALASRIEFTPQFTGRYFVEVTRPAMVKSSAGRYGGYQLRIVDENAPSPPAPACP